MNGSLAEGRGSRGYILAGFLLYVAIGAASPAASMENKPVTPRKERGSDLYMLNYNRYIDNGFYLGVSGKSHFFRKGWSVQGGARAAFLVDHIFALGAACEVLLHRSAGLLRPDRHYSILPGTPGRVRGLYGGGYISYHIFHDSIVNFSLGSIAGWGRLGGDYLTGPGSRFFFIEPEIWFFVNLPRYSRIGIGTSYRLTWGLNYMGIGDGDFRGFSAGIQVQAGIL